MKLLKKINNRKGQGVIEYALAVVVMILVVAAIVALGAGNPLNTAMNTAFTRVNTEIGNV